MPRVTRDHVGKLEHPVAGEAGDSEDLTLVNVEVHAVEPVSVNVAKFEDQR
jgi:hypothetical protein